MKRKKIRLDEKHTLFSIENNNVTLFYEITTSYRVFRIQL